MIFLDKTELKLFPYDRAAAVRYARRWAYGRNPAFYDYETIGGDCTNFASQCLYAGSGVMNFKPTFGWYYIDANNKSPSWTGVPYFYNFLTRKERNIGPFGAETGLEQMIPGTSCSCVSKTGRCSATRRSSCL